MKILVTGANGFLGYYLTRQLLEEGHEVMGTGRGVCRLPFAEGDFFRYAPMDFTDAFMVHDIFRSFAPEVVVHAGALSKVDECEENPELAWLTNVKGTEIMLEEAAAQKSLFLLVSTDFVFDGEKGMYTETDLPAPVNYYGCTKWEAERVVNNYRYAWAIVRTVLVYGKPATGKSNLLTVVRDKLEKGEEYSVVDDQLRTPTYVEDLAAGIVSIIDEKLAGIYHISGKDLLTPYEMARKAAHHLGLNTGLIKRVTAADFTQPARRPPKTGFDIHKAKKDIGFTPLSFEEGLRRTFS